MTKNEELQLVPTEQAEFVPFFKSERDYQVFCTDFHEKVKSALDRCQEARRQSEEKAKRHLVY